MLNRRELLKIPLALFRKEADPTNGELAAALLNSSEASFLRDQALLVYIDPAMRITYYGMIFRELENIDNDPANDGDK